LLDLAARVGLRQTQAKFKHTGARTRTANSIRRKLNMCVDDFGR
jgi:hypothetical protein